MIRITDDTPFITRHLLRFIIEGIFICYSNLKICQRIIEYMCNKKYMLISIMRELKENTVVILSGLFCQDGLNLQNLNKFERIDE